MSQGGLQVKTLEQIILTKRLAKLHTDTFIHFIQTKLKVPLFLFSKHRRGRTLRVTWALVRPEQEFFCIKVKRFSRGCIDSVRFVVGRLKIDFTTLGKVLEPGVDPIWLCRSRLKGLAEFPVIFPRRSSRHIPNVNWNRVNVEGTAKGRYSN